MTEPEEQCKYKHVDRSGLYIMVFLLLMETCGLKDRLNEIEAKLDSVVNSVVTNEVGLEEIEP